MAKVGGPLMSMSASGRFGELVFDQRGWVRKFTPPANPQSVDQMTQRNTLGDIQRSLKELGLVIRGELKAGLGYRWNSIVLGELLANSGAALAAYVAEYGAFQAGEKTAWESADTSTPVELTAGAVLYAVASAVYDVCLRMGVTVSLTLPANDNAATVGAEWIDDTP